MSDPITALSVPAAPPGVGLPVVAARVSAPSEPAAPGPAQRGTAQGELEAAVRMLQQQAVDVGADLEFSIDDELGRVIVTLRDRRDGSVLRQIPSEEILRIARLLRDETPPLVQAVA